MDTNQITNQMIKFNKTAFENSYSAMNTVFDQNEQMADTLLDQASWMPKEGKKAIRDWMSAYRNGCNEFKKMADENYAKVESYFGKA